MDNWAKPLFEQVRLNEIENNKQIKRNYQNAKVIKLCLLTSSYLLLQLLKY